MLKISQTKQSDRLTMKLEGAVIGSWSDELGRVWKSIATTLDSQKLRIDICDVTYVDEKGLNVLRDMATSANVEVVADNPLTRQFADEAKRSA